MKLNVEQFMNGDYFLKYSNKETRAEIKTRSIDNILDMINIMLKENRKRVPLNFEYIRVEGYFE